MKILLGFMLILLSISCNSPEQDAKEKKQDDSIRVVVDSMMKKKIDSMKRVASMPDPSQNWQIISDTDKMTSSIMIRKYVVAKDELELKFPYSGGSVATLQVRKKRGETNVFLRVSNSQFNSNVVDGEKINVRFDEGKAEKFSCSSSNDGDPTVLFINNESKFIAKLKNAKKTLIEAEFYNNGNQIMEFDTHDFIWK